MPVTTGAYPANFEQDMAAILPDYIWDEIVSDEEDQLLNFMPFSYIEASKVRWDQYQNPYGLIPLRGLNAEPDKIVTPGLKVYVADPGFYGLQTELQEGEITQSKQPNTINEPLDVGDRLGKITLDCATMVVSRFRQTTADLLIDGKFTNANAAGTLKHAYELEGYQKLTPLNDTNTGPQWKTNPTTATPISDLIYWQWVLGKGTSADFGPDSKILCNPNAVNDFWRTSEVRDKFKSKFGATFLRGELPNMNGDNSINALLMGMGLPKLMAYKRGYYATLAAAVAELATGFTYAVRDQSLIWVGKRPKQQQLGGWKLTRHAGINPTGAGAYPSVDTKNMQKAELAKGIYVNAHWRPKMPHGYDIEMGFNACPILYYARSTASIVYT